MFIVSSEKAVVPNKVLIVYYIIHREQGTNQLIRSMKTAITRDEFVTWNGCMSIYKRKKKIAILLILRKQDHKGRKTAAKPVIVPFCA